MHRSLRSQESGTRLADNYKMKFREFGDSENPTVIFLHGGGLSWWSLREVIQYFKKDYHIITPIIEGHGEAGNECFQSIEESAQHLLCFINKRCNGHVYAVAGLSIGAQIAAEVLSLDPEIAEYAVFESGLACPSKTGACRLITPIVGKSIGLVRQRWFAKMQAKALNLPEEMFERYFDDSRCITEESLKNMTMSNLNFHLQNGITKTHARVLIIAGEKENNAVLKSAHLLNDTIPHSSLYIARGLKHGELSLKFPEQYAELLRHLFSGDSIDSPREPVKAVSDDILPMITRVG
ncbi:MAG: alpha/beta fold hydrolase [Eubacteriaceae bacterium]|jgi:pimeloyl-ACP methyl ester carboxylesterase